MSFLLLNRCDHMWFDLIRLDSDQELLGLSLDASHAFQLGRLIRAFKEFKLKHLRRNISRIQDHSEFFFFFLKKGLRKNQITAATPLI